MKKLHNIGDSGHQFSGVAGVTCARPAFFQPESDNRARRMPIVAGSHLELMAATEKEIGTDEVANFANLHRTLEPH